MAKERLVEERSDKALVPRFSEDIRLDTFQDLLRITPVTDEICQGKHRRNCEHGPCSSRRPERCCRNETPFRIENLVHTEKPKQRNVVEGGRFALNEEAKVGRKPGSDQKHGNKSRH